MHAKKNPFRRFLAASWIAAGGLAMGQTEPAAAPTSAPANPPVATVPIVTPQLPVPAAQGSGNGQPAQSNSSFLGGALPHFDPGSEVFSWDGKHWNISDQRIFRGRFEKYLNAPAQTEADDLAYNKILDEIYEKLAAGSSHPVVDVWKLLPKASSYESDANLCDSLADAIYGVWLAQRQVTSLTAANRALRDEFETLNWGAQVKTDSSKLTRPSKNASDQEKAQWAAEEEMKRTFRLKPYVTRMTEVEAMIKANEVKSEASELRAKIELQALIAQFFLQRRFQHVLIGSRFYRKLFGDGDTKLVLGKKTQSLFSDASGLPPTLSILDSLANEAIRDIRESVNAYQFLLSKNELNSATQRLAEAFIIGEYMPEIRTLDREKKRQALEFTQLGNQLLSAIEVKDYARAEKIVKELEIKAKDFDNAKPMAAIETAKAVSALHLAKARNAAASGDKVTLENELKSAMQVWPRNPALAEVSSAIFDQSDVQQQALNDFERLLSQKNYRQIFDDRVRFIAATALFPDRQEKLRDILEKMQMVDTAIIQANEVAKRGDPCGAWESVERVYEKFPDDVKLNQLRAELTTRSAEFVRSLSTAKGLEDKQQYGSSLAWYLKAQEIYPGSEFARDGINRSVDRLVPQHVGMAQGQGPPPADGESKSQ
jgi:hypothetical protein